MGGVSKENLPPENSRKLQCPRISLGQAGPRYSKGVGLLLSQLKNRFLFIERLLELAVFMNYLPKGIVLRWSFNPRDSNFPKRVAGG